MITLRDVREDIRSAKTLLDSSVVEPNEYAQKIRALLVKVEGDLQDIEAALIQVTNFEGGIDGKNTSERTEG